MDNLQNLQNILNQALKEIPKKSLQIVGVQGKNFINKNFRDQGFTDSSLEKWKPRKTTDAKRRDITKYRTNRKGRKGALNKYGSQNKGRAILTGHQTAGDKLRNSFRYKINNGNNQVVFYTYKEYAQRHNEGLDSMHKRQFMGRSMYLNEQIATKLHKELHKILK